MGASTQGSNCSSGIRGEAGRCDKAACSHQTFHASIAILQKDQKVWGGVLCHCFSSVINPREAVMVHVKVCVLKQATDIGEE